MTGDSPHHLRKSIQLLIRNARSLRVHRVAQSFRRDRVGVLRMLDHFEDLHLMNCTATQERAGDRGVGHRAQANCRESPWNNVLKQSPLHADLLGASGVNAGEARPEARPLSKVLMDSTRSEPVAARR